MKTRVLPWERVKCCLCSCNAWQFYNERNNYNGRTDVHLDDNLKKIRSYILSITYAKLMSKHTSTSLEIRAGTVYRYTDWLGLNQLWKSSIDILVWQFYYLHPALVSYKLLQSCIDYNQNVNIFIYMYLSVFKCVYNRWKSSSFSSFALLSANLYQVQIFCTHANPKCTYRWSALWCIWQ